MWSDGMIFVYHAFGGPFLFYNFLLQVGLLSILMYIVYKV